MPEMKKAPYIIMAPPYRHTSGGVRALYELRRYLEDRGYVAEIVQSGNAPSDTIVIYPETVSGNPMNGRTVVRWVLYFPGVLGGDKKYDPREIIFTYTPVFYPDAKVLNIPITEDFFRDQGLPREGGCFWVGKGKDVPKIPETDGLTEITIDRPLSRKELAQLFNEKEIFYSYDPCTALVLEARCCGCKVVVIPEETPIPSPKESIKAFDGQLDDFIRITQAASQKETG